jgi:hypothetical protein
MKYSSGDYKRKLFKNIEQAVKRGDITPDMIKQNESVVNEAKKRKIIVTNEKTGRTYDVLSGTGKGDLLIAMKALQKAAPSHMKYDIKESAVNEGLDENKKIDWSEFYKLAKGGPSTLNKFEKKYGKLLDKPHIKDALENTKDFKSFMRHIRKFESVVNERRRPPKMKKGKREDDVKDVRSMLRSLGSGAQDSSKDYSDFQKLKKKALKIMDDMLRIASRQIA